MRYRLAIKVLAGDYAAETPHRGTTTARAWKAMRKNTRRALRAQCLRRECWHRYVVLIGKDSHRACLGLWLFGEVAHG